MRNFFSDAHIMAALCSTHTLRPVCTAESVPSQQRQKSSVISKNTRLDVYFLITEPCQRCNSRMFSYHVLIEKKNNKKTPYQLIHTRGSHFLNRQYSMIIYGLSANFQAYFTLSSNFLESMSAKIQNGQN